eukprot:TRINITY_DN10988_c0_g1_i1.p1 TRINITY_DN10988_c0_g1~~TRINITY_DN10988_c0_g1_i1.p1  ORF type:complete len:683 (+),score=171.39 TRINITY_DN10988_c0_g1_i1:71-2050(+)
MSGHGSGRARLALHFDEADRQFNDGARCRRQPCDWHSAASLAVAAAVTAGARLRAGASGAGREAARGFAAGAALRLLFNDVVAAPRRSSSHVDPPKCAGFLSAAAFPLLVAAAGAAWAPAAVAFAAGWAAGGVLLAAGARSLHRRSSACTPLDRLDRPSGDRHTPGSPCGPDSFSLPDRSQPPSGTVRRVRATSPRSERRHRAPSGRPAAAPTAAAPPSRPAPQDGLLIAVPAEASQGTAPHTPTITVAPAPAQLPRYDSAGQQSGRASVNLRRRATQSQVIPPDSADNSPSPRTADGDMLTAENSDALCVEWEDLTLDVPIRDLRRRALIRWQSPVRKVLLVKKWQNERATRTARRVAQFLGEQGVEVAVEGSQLADYAGAAVSVVEEEDPANEVDLVVTLGGDGTLLHLSRLFDRGDGYGPLPPCIVFSMGSLGFLANWSVEGTGWHDALSRALRGTVHPLHATMRTRLRCVVRNGAAGETLHHVLNECVVLSRGDAIAKIRVFVDGDFLTLMEGDGLIVATPTGSTGYTMSCGGSVVAPSVPCTLLTPIAAASLSFRPVIVNEMSTLRLELPRGARAKRLDVIFDGRKDATLLPGGHVEIQTSRWPLPVINVAHLDRDWLDGLSSKLKWNARGAEQEDESSRTQARPRSLSDTLAS